MFRLSFLCVILHSRLSVLGAVYVFAQILCSAWVGFAAVVQPLGL